MDKVCIDTIFEGFHKPGRADLIPVLQKEQERSGFLSKDAMITVAKKLNLPASKVFGVASFYNQFKFEAPGKNHIQICRGTACHVKGSATILETIERETGITAGHTSSDGLFSLEVVACVGACSLAPLIVLNGKFHAKVSDKDIRKIIATIRKEATHG